jgi:hypothetical protein
MKKASCNFLYFSYTDYTGKNFKRIKQEQVGEDLFWQEW